MRTSPFRRATVVALMIGFGCNRDATAPQLTPAPILRTESAAVPTLERFYGPERFTRTRGATNDFTREISTVRFEAPFVLHVRSGAPDGAGRASAAALAIDGKVLLSAGDFARQTEWAVPVTLGQAAILRIALSGSPDSFVEVWLEGKRSDPIFCPDGPAGTYPTLPEAITAAAVDGTVLVCDGEHAIDLVRIRKPITLRSQNPGGATLADADPNPAVQSGRPALIVDSVPAGTVRLVDLNFLVRGRGVYAGGQFDHVVLDSVRFIGRNLTVPYGVWIDRSSIAAARVDISRSRFESMAIGIFPVAEVETNVSWSTFDNFGGGAVTYSGRPGTPAPSVSFGRTEHNTFANCSVHGCIRVVGPAQPSREVVIAHNVMTRPTGPTQSATIVVARSALDAAAPRAPVIVEHNRATGAVVGNAASSHEQAWWSVASFVNNLGGIRGSSVIVRYNRLTDYYVGISASAPVTAHDNYFMSGHRAIMQLNNAVDVDFQRNDVYFEMSIYRAQDGGIPGNYRCNWWGSSLGPAHPTQNVPAIAYSPWATQPIANTAIPCDPTPPTVVRVCATSLEGGPITFPTLALAYSAVVTGGTVLFCDGTHIVQDVRIDRAVTVRSEGPGKATLDASGALSTLDIRDVTGGPVVVRSLQFRGAAAISSTSDQVQNAGNVRLGGTYTSVTIEDSDFAPSSGTGTGFGHGELQFNAGILINREAGGGSVAILRNRFTGGDIGVTSYAPGVTISGNRFRTQAFYAVYLGLGGSTVVSDNDINGCGTTAVCIAVHDNSAVSIVRNRIEVSMARPMWIAVLVDAVKADISGNTITGTGGDGVTSFPITRTAIAVHATNGRAAQSSVSVNGNLISGAASPFEFAVIANPDAIGSSLVVDASDNIASNIGTAITVSGMSGTVSLRMSRNDFSGYANVYYGPSLSNVALQCNWWGSTTGPINPPTQFLADVFTPWATEPIANNGGVACN